MRGFWSITEKVYSELVSYIESALSQNLWVVHDVLIKFMQKQEEEAVIVFFKKRILLMEEIALSYVANTGKFFSQSASELGGNFAK